MRSSKSNLSSSNWKCSCLISILSLLIKRTNNLSFSFGGRLRTAALSSGSLCSDIGLKLVRNVEFLRFIDKPSCRAGSYFFIEKISQNLVALSDYHKVTPFLLLPMQIGRAHV